MSTLALPPATPRTLLRHGLINVLVCSLIALWLSTLSDSSLIDCLIYSQAIGTLCWLLLDGGRLLTARLLAVRHPEQPQYRHGWPGWRWMAPIIVLGVPLAYAAGSFIGDAWTGHRSAMPWAGADGRHGWGSYLFLLALSFVAAAGISGFNYARQMLLLTRAEAERAQRIASETQLRLLESQLEPHMLFNTLANLRVLISLDPPRAQQMLDHLIAFLRATLDASRQGGSHSLQAEFRRLDDYLALLAIRMGPRLQVHLDLPTELQQLPVPPLLLQPLVENSIKHGLEPQIDGGRIEIRARTDGERLRLTVQDNGAGLGTATRSDGSDTLGGFGLRQIRERLHSLHGPAARFELQAAPGGGTLACIELPLQPAGPQQTSSTP